MFYFKIIRKVWRGGLHYEGPHWSSTENALYWVDIIDQKVHRLDPDTENVTTHNIGQHSEYRPLTNTTDHVSPALMNQITNYKINLS